MLRAAGRPAVYVLGDAGVGKTTLVNTLLSDWLAPLPSVGVGPHTAVPVQIRFAAEPYSEIRWRGREFLVALIVAIEAAPGAGSPAVRMGRQLVEGNQFGAAPAEYLIACLRAAVEGGLPAALREQDRGRVALLADVVSRPQEERVRVRHAGPDLPAFLHDLDLHCAGFIAPLVEQVVIGWDTPFLASGIELVDLPGVGVANDSYPARTRAAIAAAGSVILVVDRGGLTEPAARVLRPFFDRMLGARASEPLPALVVAAVKLDMIATDARLAEPAGRRRPWVEHFEDVSKQMVRTVRAQLQTELGRTSNGRHGAVELSRAMERITVIPVAPVEHKRCSRDDPEDRPSIPNADASGIASLRGMLAAMARWKTPAGTPAQQGS